MKYLSRCIGALFLLSDLAIVWLDILGLAELDLFSVVCMILFFFIGFGLMFTELGANSEDNHIG
jgi:hypothetical protein